jgi:hypothetical protein
MPTIPYLWCVASPKRGPRRFAHVAPEWLIATQLRCLTAERAYSANLVEGAFCELLLETEFSEGRCRAEVAR